MSSARRSDPQRSAPQDKKNVVLPCRRTTFLSLRVLSWGGREGEHRTNRTEAAERPGAFCSGMPGRSGRPGNGRQAAGMSGGRWAKGMNDRRRNGRRRVVRVVRVVRVRKNRRTRSRLPENDRRSDPIRPDTARTDHTGRCTLQPGNRLHVREPENLKTGKPKLKSRRAEGRAKIFRPRKNPFPKESGARNQAWPILGPESGTGCGRGISILPTLLS